MRCIGEAAGQLWQDRQAAEDQGLQGPGHAEYIDLLRVVVTLETTPDEAVGAARQGAGLRAQKTPAGGLMMPLRTRTAVGRADLLRVYAEQGEQALEQAAGALGYERRRRRVR
jgi:hypothetical protein